MHIVRNQRRINILSDVGQYASLGGLLALLAGLVISFTRPRWLIPMLASVTVGFILSVAGGYLASRYAGSLAHHQALAEMLKGLDYRHTLLQYVLPASHVLLEPGGCTVFVVKTQGGEVAYEDGKWKHHQRGKIFRQIVGEERLGAPHLEAEREIRKLERYLDQHVDGAERVPVRAAIVFVNPDVQVEADDSPVPAFYRKKVKAWLRGRGNLEPLPDDARHQLAKALGTDQG